MGSRPPVICCQKGPTTEVATGANPTAIARALAADSSSPIGVISTPGGRSGRFGRRPTDMVTLASSSAVAFLSSVPLLEWYILLPADTSSLAKLITSKTLATRPNVLIGSMTCDFEKLPVRVFERDVKSTYSSSPARMRPAQPRYP